MRAVCAPRTDTLNTELVDQFEKEAASIFKEEWFQRLGTIGMEYFLTVGLSNEVGELQQLYKRKLAGTELRNTDVSNELGDVIWHVANIAHMCGISMQEVMINSMLKFRSRYPHRFKEV